MVKKRTIAPKPATPPPEADNWVKGGGLDPELQIQPPPPPPQESPPIQLEQGQLGQGKDKKAFPHRISFDTDTAQYKRLKRAGFEREQRLTEIVREAVEDWLQKQGY